tara:strand:- start:2 stop:1375 length:1374 start_codon:yes stop_codon:yes gene_type:complete
MAKKKILILSDDIRMHSGVATVSKDIVLETLHKYDWVQIGGAVKHPDEGKIIDMSQSAKNDYGVDDAYLKVYPVTGYGNPTILRQVMEIEKPDAILHFTDPRFWTWLYQMEHEIRQNIPIMYYNIWDDLPDPMYNANFYRSSDLLMGISKQTYGINKRILKHFGYEDWQTAYVPHGVSDRKFNKILGHNVDYENFKIKYQLDKYKFKILYLNRNIRRKCPGDVALAYKHFMDGLTEEQRKECCLVFHSAPTDENGTDMKAVCKALLPDYPVIFTYDFGGPLDDKGMNHIFNSADLYINMASNEGFGLGSLEALTVGTPIVVNVTGGMQDQCGFKKEDGTYLTSEDYVELGSNHRGTYKEHGEWVKPVFPSNLSLQGSPMTPYIFDDRCSYEDAGDAIRYWYDKGPEEREKCGELGMKFVKDKNIGMDSKEMADRMIKSIEATFKNWKPREKYTLEVV